MAVVLEGRTALARRATRFMDWFGGGWFGVVLVPVSIAILLLTAPKTLGRALLCDRGAAQLGVVQLLKSVFDRPRPGTSWWWRMSVLPSGHVANAATTAVVLAIILQRWWVWFAGSVYIVLMAFSRTYLGAHWLSDTIGGALIGAGMALIVWAPLAYRLERGPRGR